MDVKCILCIKRFDDLSTMKRHVRIFHHVTEDGIGYKCQQGSPPCERAFSTLRTLYRHINNCHENRQIDVDEYLCNDSQTLEVCEGSPVNADPEYAYEAVESSSASGIDSDELEFILGIFTETNLQRKNADTIINLTKKLLLKKNITSSSFDNFATEKQRINTFKRLKIWLEPNSMVLDYQEKIVGEEVVTKPIKASFYDLKNLCECIFSTPVMLNAAMKYLTKPKNEILADIKDGSLLRDCHENTVPFIIFFDELEVGNALGSHKGAQKLGIFYVSFRCFEPYLYSNLDSIFPYIIVPAEGKPYTHAVMTKVKEDILTLESGLDLNGVHLNFRLVSVVGDNLGVHQITGYVESFSANYPCIACKVDRTTMREQVQLNPKLLRNRTNYIVDVEKNDVSSTGIKSECPLNHLKDFHVTENIVFDLMHDMMEGVCKYAMLEILSYFVNEVKFFDLATLNLRIDNVPFNRFSLNKPPVLKSNIFLKEDIPLSAAEMKNFVLIFSVAVGDFVPDDDPVWNFYIVHKRLLNLLLLKEITEDLANYIDLLIAEHNHLYVTLFKKTLKPKFHNLLHYKSVLLKAGPMSNFWCMRFESYNRRIKEYTNVIKSRVNLPHSILMRASYKLANTLTDLRSHENLDHLALKVGPTINNCDAPGEEVYYKNLTVKGKKFFVGAVIPLESPQDELYPDFRMIKKLSMKESECKAYVNSMKLLVFDDHLDSFLLAYPTGNVMDEIELKDAHAPLLHMDRFSFIIVPNVGI